MLIKLFVENYRVFSSEVTLSLEADLRTKKFRSNIITNSQANIIKSLAVFGPNNTGKTCLLQAMRDFKSVLLNQNPKLQPNLFSSSPIVKLGAEFLFEEKRYRYHFKFDTNKKVFEEEFFAQYQSDKYNNLSQKEFFYRNVLTQKVESSDKELEKVMNLSSKDNILIHTLNTSNLPLLEHAKRVLKKFADTITVLSTHGINPDITIELLKNPNTHLSKQIVTLIKNADLDIEDFKYDDTLNSHLKIEMDDENLKEKGIQMEKIVDILKLTSIHKGKKLPSIIFDSLGTKRIVSLAGYIVQKLNQGGILLIDELDSGLHFKLTRAIVSLFNSIENNKAQLIFSTHDASLLDTKTLFRKEQIWFTDKDDSEVYLYALSDFTSQNSGLRAEGDVYEYYSKNLLGALPDPSLIDILLLKDGEANE